MRFSAKADFATVLICSLMMRHVRVSRTSWDNKLLRSSKPVFQPLSSVQLRQVREPSA